MRLSWKKTVNYIQLYNSIHMSENKDTSDSEHESKKYTSSNEIILNENDQFDNFVSPEDQVFKISLEKRHLANGPQKDNQDLFDNENLFKLQENKRVLRQQEKEEILKMQLTNQELYSELEKVISKTDFESPESEERVEIT